MSSERENVEVLQGAYRRWAESLGQDREAWNAIIAEDLTLHSAPDGAEPMAFTARRSGREEFQHYLDGLAADWDMVHYSMDDFIAQGDRVVVKGRVGFRHKGTGKVADLPKVDIWRMEAGKAKEYEEVFDTAAAFAAARPD